MAEVEVGQPAPAFRLLSQTGEEVSLDDLRGQVVVLYFYPKDDTPGCTKEACSFRDNFAALRDAGAVVLGVSRDTVHSHRKFSDKYALQGVTLLADENSTVCEAYGVLKEKNMYGRKTIGIARTTFIIGKEGLVAKVFPKVKVDGHVEEVLDFVRSL